MKNTVLYVLIAGLWCAVVPTPALYGMDPGNEASVEESERSANTTFGAPTRNDSPTSDVSESGSQTQFENGPSWAMIFAATTISLGILFCGYKLGRCLLGWLRGKKRTVTDPFKEIRLGGQRCRGLIQPLTAQATMKMVVVDRQPDGVSCAWHALKNSMLATDLYAGTGLVERFTDRDLTNRVFADWQQYASQNGHVWNEAHSGAIEAVYAYEQARGCITKEHRAYPLTVIDVPEMIGVVGDTASRSWWHDAREGTACPITVTLSQELTAWRDAGRQNPYIHSFLVNFSQYTKYNENGIPTAGSVSHWVAVTLCMQSNGNREYLITDSLNHVRFDDQTIKKLVDQMEHVIRNTTRS